MPEPLNTLERNVLDYLIEYVRRNTYQPSIREIGARFDLKSTKTVSELLQSLAEKGWIERDASRSRGVRLLGLDLGADVVSVPHIDVHLSDPALQDPIDSLALDRRIVGSSACFMTSMVGNDMLEAGVRDGDLLVVAPVEAHELDEGDLAVVRTDGESAVRRVLGAEAGAVLEGGRIDLAPISVRNPAVEVLGRVVAVLRRLRTDAPAGRVRAPKGEGAIAR